jgi:Ca2+-binding RTX toxin-like protein
MAIHLLTEDVDDVTIKSDGEEEEGFVIVAEGDEVHALGGNDFLFVEANKVTVDGGLGDDFLRALGNGITLRGGDGGDTLQSGGGALNTTMEGGAGNDALTGNDSAEVFYGGAGDDRLTGNLGGDVFKYSFKFEPASAAMPDSFSKWLQSEHGLNVGNLQQNQFVQAYKDWLGYVADELRENHGFGSIPENAEVSFKQNDPNGMPQIEGLTKAQLADIFGDASAISVKTGKTSQVRFFSDIDPDSAIWEGGQATLTSGDGHDVITDFLWDVDELDFTGLDGLNQGQFELFFKADPVNAGGDPDSMDTTLALKDGSWSVTLYDVNKTIGDFYTDIFS